VTALGWLPPFGTLSGELARAAIAGVGFLLLFAVAEAWRALRNPPVEWTRKLVHFVGGLIAVAFPWLFTSHWTVLALGGAFFLILWGTRRLGLLQSVHGVTRHSEGGLYYPVAIYLLFVIAANRPVFYLISILALVVSDTVAAVLGSTYGRVGYTVQRDRRTVEGSVVFFLSTFLICHLPLLLLTNTPPLLSVLVGLQLAMIVTLFEGISIRGNDNLLVPLLSYFLLLKLTARDPAFLAYQIAAQLAIMTIVALMAWRFQFLTASGAMAFMLFFYGAYSLGGEEWTVAPGIALLAFIVYYLSRYQQGTAADPRYQVVSAFYVAIVPALLYVANNVLETMVRAPTVRADDPFYAVFLGAVASQLALAVYHAHPAARGRGGRLAALLVLAPLAAFLLVVPLGLLVSAVDRSDSVLVAAAVVLGAVVVHGMVQGLVARTELHSRLRGRWALRVQTLSVATAAALVVPWTLR
jgi:dolichol kinase